jgi:diguanylate cyclase
MSLSPAQIAKAALHRLALSKLEPTPENYARAWAEEGGAAPSVHLPERARAPVERLVQRVSEDAALRSDLSASLMQGRWDELQRALDRNADASAASARAWAALIDRLARGLERGSSQWTSARRKESMNRVLDGSGGDLQRLQLRLRQLVTTWERDGTAAAGEAEAAAPAPVAAVETPVAPAPEPSAWPQVVTGLSATVRAALPESEPRASELADELAALAARIAREGATAGLAAEVDAVCQRARRLLAHRHHLLDQLAALCRELTAGMTELAEDSSWAQGQGQAMQNRLEDGLTARSIKAASEMLAQTRRQQQSLRDERDRARDALKGLMQSFLAQLGDLGDQTGRFTDRLGHYGEVIQRAESVDQLSGLVRDMLEDSRAVQARVQQTQQRLGDEHARASELESRVRDLEGELRRLSEEVSTDALTEVANRRGLAKAFEAERARLQRHGGDLAVGLLDIDNFKKLNDTLGHSAGDVALKALAVRVRASLRPVDIVARYGGEEFVVLLPGTPVDEAQQALTRLQRSLSSSLFMHDGREVFVTFSAGVTAYRLDEPIDAALERADEGLYEAKRSGKNRTCIT